MPTHRDAKPTDLHHTSPLQEPAAGRQRRRLPPLPSFGSGLVMLMLAYGATASSAALAQPMVPDDAIDVGELQQELMKMHQEGDRMVSAYWLPPELWRIAARNGPAPAAQDLAQVEQLLEPYFVVVAFDGTIDVQGGATFVPEATLRSETVLIDEHGEPHRALADSELPPGVRDLSALIRPLLEGLMGPLGKGMTLLFFPARDADGTRVASAGEPGAFSVRVRDVDLTWRLPLGSLLPTKICPVGGEFRSGAWSFCPIHGAKLVSQAEVEERLDELARSTAQGGSMLNPDEHGRILTRLTTLGKAALPTMLKGLEAADPNRRAAAAEVLSGLDVNTPELRSALRRSLERPDNNMAALLDLSLALSALGDSEAAVDGLLRLLEHPLPVGRAFAAAGLGQLGASAAKATPALRECARSDPDPRVRRAASDAAEKIAAAKNAERQRR